MSGESPDDVSPRGLLGDLEQIRELLDDPPAPQEASQPDAGPVPLLEDVVGGGIEVDEPSFASRPGLGTARRSALSQATIEVLLGDAWQSSSDEALSAARASLGMRTEPHASADETEPTRVLKARLDAAIGAWLCDLVTRNVDDLRATLAQELGDAFERILSKPGGSKAGDSKTGDARDP